LRRQEAEGGRQNKESTVKTAKITKQGRSSPSPLIFRIIFFGVNSSRLLRSSGRWHCQSPSFPHAFSGNPGEFRTGPPIEAFGGDNLGKSHPEVLLIRCSSLRGDSSAKDAKCENFSINARAASLPGARLRPWPGIWPTLRSDEPLDCRWLERKSRSRIRQ
jgi:hypothetical protein